MMCSFSLPVELIWIYYENKVQNDIAKDCFVTNSSYFYGYSLAMRNENYAFFVFANIETILIFATQMMNFPLCGEMRRSHKPERWQSGWMRRSWKPLRMQVLPGFESLSLRNLWKKPQKQNILRFRGFLILFTIQ